MQENIDQNSWKYKIAEQIVSSYKKDCPMSEHIYEKVIMLQLLWHATTMIKGNKVGQNGPEEEAMVEIKYIGQRYWSQDAINKYIKNNPNGYKKKGGLTHEHAIPRNIIQSMIEEILDEQKEENKKKAIYDVLNKYSTSIIISKEENGKINSKYKGGFGEDKDWEKEYIKNGNAIEGEEFIDFMQKHRYKGTNIKIKDLGKEVFYDKRFKDQIKKYYKDGFKKS
jgi:hypothetical protein